MTLEFKSHKKTVEKETSAIIKELIDSRTKSFGSASEAAQHFKGLKEKLQGLRQSLQTFDKVEEDLMALLGKRVATLSSIESIDPSSDKLENAKGIDTFIDLLITDFKARQDSMVPGEQPLEWKTYQLSKQIHADLSEEKTTSALEWCQTHRSKLQKCNTVFEFRLREAEFIKILQTQGSIAAMNYLQDYLKEYDSEWIPRLKLLGKAIFYGQSASKRPELADLFTSPWKDLQELFLDALFQVQGITRTSLLETLLGAGLSALKTPFCGQSPGISCPVCHPLALPLASHLPAATKSTSTLLCRILGQIMDESNPPIILPNNQIYSTKGIEKIAMIVPGTSEKRIVCPTTGEEFLVSQVKKIFLTS